MAILYLIMPLSYSVASADPALESSVLDDASGVVTYSAILTGVGDGLPDLELKAIKFSFSKAAAASVEDAVSVSVDASTLDGDEVDARPNGHIKITQSIAHTTGDYLDNLLLDLPVSSVTKWSGSTSKTYTLIGAGLVDHSAVFTLGVLNPTEISGKLLNNGSVELLFSSATAVRYEPNSIVTVEGVDVTTHTVEVSVQASGVTTRMHR